MSLQVWLPLTKDLRQQGLSNIAVTNNGATSNTSGKLGGCYSFNGSSSYLTLPQGYIGSSWSYALWVYTSASTTQTLGCCRTAVGTGFSIFLSKSGKIRIDAGISATSSQWTVNYAYPTNTWFHLVITANNSEVKYYINGEYKETHTVSTAANQWGNIFSIGASQAGGSSYGNYLNGKLNDVRIYNHCLSPMEVKQLSQGLVLHYPLNRQGWGQENLVTNTHTEQSGVNTYKFWTFGTNNNLTAGETCIVSFDAKATVANVACDVYFRSSSGMVGSSKIINGIGTTYKRFSTTLTVPSSTYVSIAIRWNSNVSGANTSATYTFKDVKVEKGEIATPWCPNSADTLYTTMGINGTTEYDCSGFCNNGTWHGTHTNTSDTPKYAVSTTATGSGTTYLEGPVLPAEAKTVALWIKNTSKSSNGAIFNDKTTGLQIGLLNSLLYMNSKASTAGFTTTHWVNGEWNHVVAVNNNGTRSLYVNGQAETQSGASNYYIHNADNCWLWNRSYNNNYPFTGSLCDLRVYATALSADDVKSLYQNCATIDPDGTIRGQIRS